MATTLLAHVDIKSFTPETAQTEAAKSLAAVLAEKISTGPVFLLLSGGSAIAMYKAMFDYLEVQSQDWASLTASLLDERAVPLGSAESNEQQLRETGIIERITLRGGRWISYLEHGVEWPAVAQRVSDEFQTVLDTRPYIIIAAGIGDDGHTSGLLPTQDPATIQNVFESSALIKNYELPADTANPFRHRLTTTPAFIRQASLVMIYALGAKKLPALQRFLNGEDNLPDCPALALRSAAGVMLFTDQNVGQTQ